MSDPAGNPTPGNRKPIPQIFLTRTQSDVILQAQRTQQAPEDIALVEIEPDSLIENNGIDTESHDDVTTMSVTSSHSLLSEEEVAVLDQFDAVLEDGLVVEDPLGDGRDTLRIDSLDIDISTNYTFKGVEGGSTSPLMNALRSSFSKVYILVICSI